MAREIWKFPIESDGLCSIPKGAQILSVQMQGDQPTMWAICDPENDHDVQRLGIYGTGHDLPEKLGEFIDTFQIPEMGLVFHVFAPAE